MKKEIRSLVEKAIRESILNTTTNYGTKIFINFEGDVKSLSVPNALWSSSTWEKELCFIPSLKDTFKYEDAGLVKNNISEKSFRELVEMYVYDEDVSLEDAIEFWSNSCDYKLLYHFGQDWLEEALEKHIDNYIGRLNIKINDDLTVDIVY